MLVSDNHYIQLKSFMQIIRNDTAYSQKDRQQFEEHSMLLLLKGFCLVLSNRIYAKIRRYCVLCTNSTLLLIFEEKSEILLLECCLKYNLAK